MANNTITGSLNNGYIRYASKEDIKSIVDEMTQNSFSITTVTENVNIAATSQANVAIPLGVPYESPSFKMAFMGEVDGKPIPITVMSTTFYYSNLIVKVGFHADVSPYFAKGGRLVTRFSWEV